MNYNKLWWKIDFIFYPWVRDDVKFSFKFMHFAFKCWICFSFPKLINWNKNLRIQNSTTGILNKNKLLLWNLLSNYQPTGFGAVKSIMHIVMVSQDFYVQRMIHTQKKKKKISLCLWNNTSYKIVYSRKPKLKKDVWHRAMPMILRYRRPSGTSSWRRLPMTWRYRPRRPSQIWLLSYRWDKTRHLMLSVWQRVSSWEDSFIKRMVQQLHHVPLRLSKCG